MKKISSRSLSIMQEKVLSKSYKKDVLDIQGCGEAVNGMKAIVITRRI